MSLLEVRDLHAGYGGRPVLHGLSFDLRLGETTVLFGLNGAGKTTLVNTLAGLISPTRGQVVLDGQPLTGLDSSAVVAAGVALAPEARRVFPGLSVAANLALGAWVRRRQRADIAATLAEVYDYFPRLAQRRGQPAGMLSGGEQQMLAVGRALMSAPRLLLIDEASLGLAPKLVHELFAILGQIKADGTTVLLVEQNVSVLPYAEQALVLEKGELGFVGPAAELARTGALTRAYLGDSQPVAG